MVCGMHTRDIGWDESTANLMEDLLPVPGCFPALSMELLAFGMSC